MNELGKHIGKLSDKVMKLFYHHDKEILADEEKEALDEEINAHIEKQLMKIKD